MFHRIAYLCLFTFLKAIWYNDPFPVLQVYHMYKLSLSTSPSNQHICPLWLKNRYPKVLSLICTFIISLFDKYKVHYWSSYSTTGGLMVNTLAYRSEGCRFKSSMDQYYELTISDICKIDIIKLIRVRKIVIEQCR